MSTNSTEKKKPQKPRRKERNEDTKTESTEKRRKSGVGYASLLDLFIGDKCPFCVTSCGYAWCPYN